MEEISGRKLAVLLHADIVDSTTLVRLNETVAHQRIRDTFERLSATAARHGGIIHEVRGDAVIAEFSMVSDAVTAAVEFQAANHDRDSGDAMRPVTRIGIAMGEVVVSDNTVTGEGIVLAQRLEQLAEAGGIRLQGAAYDTVPKRLPFHFENLGEHELKGFDEPVRVYAVTPLSETGQAPKNETAEAGSAGPSLPREPSIAVLPFANMSDDAGQDYFADGITEDIITALSRISGLMVIARNSTMVYKNRAVDVRQVAQEQGVRYVLEGSVRKAGNRVRVTAQLIDAASGHHQWAERYDRDLDDVFAVQDEITQQITLEMRVQISIGEKARMMVGRTSNTEVWERLARADELSNSLIKSDNDESRRLAEEAIRIDPKSVAAWTELGWSHWADIYFGWSASPQESRRLALEAADKARELEPDYPNTYSLLGFLTLLDEDFDRALEFLEKGVMLAPNNAENTAELALGLVMAGVVDQAQDMIQRAMRLSPICPAWYLMVDGLCAMLSNDQKTAISTLQSAVEMEPESAWSRAYLVSVLVDCERMDEARQLARSILSLERGFSVDHWHGARFRDADMRARVIENLRLAGLPG